jgi:hypothetical protein
MGILMKAHYFIKCVSIFISAYMVTCRSISVGFEIIQFNVIQETEILGANTKQRFPKIKCTNFIH